MWYDLSRRVDLNDGNGFSSWVATIDGGSLNAGSTAIAGNGYTQPHGATVEFRYREGTSNPSNSDSYVTVSDSSDPNNVQSSRDHTGITLSLTINCPTTSWTATTSLGACSAEHLFHRLLLKIQVSHELF